MDAQPDRHRGRWPGGRGRASCRARSARWSAWRSWSRSASAWSRRRSRCSPASSASAGPRRGGDQRLRADASADGAVRRAAGQRGGRADRARRRHRRGRGVERAGRPRAGVLAAARAARRRRGRLDHVQRQRGQPADPGHAEPPARTRAGRVGRVVPHRPDRRSGGGDGGQLLAAAAVLPLRGHARRRGHRSGWATLRHSELAAGQQTAIAPLPLRTALRDRAYIAALVASFAGDFALVGSRSSIVPQFVTERLRPRARAGSTRRSWSSAWSAARCCCRSGTSPTRAAAAR